MSAESILASFGAELVKSLAKDLVSDMLKAIGRSAAQPFQTPARQQALEETFAEALGRALAALPLQADLTEHYRGLFEDFFHRPAVQKELSLLLHAPRPEAALDLALLRREFDAAGYDPTLLPGLDFDRFIAALVTAFTDVAADRDELQGALQIGLLRRLAGELQGLIELGKRTAQATEATAEHTAVLPEIRDLLRGRLEGPAPQPPPAPIPAPIPNPRALRLVGREAERDWLRGRLRCGDVAALAGVRGIGGIGKTELAIAVARELEGEFAGGVVWLDCGPNDAYAIQDRMAKALGVTLQHDDLRLRADQLAMAWRGQPPTLVVLDDVRRRHLADFGCIEPPRPPCALLVTSRRSDLPLPGAAVRELDPLTPAQSGDLLASMLPPGIVEAEPQAAADVAELLENIPLALVLAARRADKIAHRRDDSAHRPLAALLEELRARRARVLDQGERPDLSVLIAFDASADDLEPADQARLRRLGVFARNEFDLFAVAAVWEEDEETARRALQRLADAGLVEEVEEATWWMHDLLREYAGERLKGAADEGAARLAHARCWQRYLEETDPRSVEDWRDLAAHRAEVERAADWLLGDGPREPGLAVGLALQIAWTFPVGMLPQQADWLRAGLDAAGALLAAATRDEDRQTARRRIAQTQSSLADLLSTRGQYDEAERLYRESLRVKEALGDSREVAVTQSSLASLLSTRGQYDEAERLYRSGLEICRRIRDPQGVAVYLMGLGQLALSRGRREEALPLLQEARQGFVALGLAHWVAAVDQLLAQAGAHMPTLDDLLAMVRAARGGDAQTGEQAWQICDGLARAPDPAYAALGRALQAILVGTPPEAALASLPAELHAHILEALQGQHPHSSGEGV